MSLRQLLFCCLLFCCTTLNAQQLSIDSLFGIIRYEKAVDKKFDAAEEAQFQIAVFDPRTELFDTLDNLLVRLLAELKSNGDSSLVAGVLHLRGKIIAAGSDFKSAINFYNESLTLYAALKDSSGMASAYKILGTTNIRLNRFNTAINYFFKYLRIAEHMHDTDAMRSACFSIGKVYHDRELEPRKSIDYFRKYTASDTALPPINCAFLAREFLFLQIPDSAAYYLELAKPLLTSPYLFHGAFGYKALASYYQYNKQFDSASICYQKAIHRFNTAHDEFNAVSCYYRLGEMAFLEGKTRLAEKYFLDAESYALKYHYFELPRVYVGLSGVYEMLHQPSRAYSMLKNYKGVMDSLRKTEESDILLATDLRHQFILKEELLKEQQLRKEFEKIALVKQQRELKIIAVVIISLVTLFALVFLFQRLRIGKEKKRSDALLLNILPGEVAEELKDKGRADAKHFDDVTVMFSDFKNFTTISESLSPKELVAEIDTCFRAFDRIIGKYNIEKIKTIGDSYMCVGGLPVANKTHAEDIVLAALEIIRFMDDPLNTSLLKKYGGVRIGIHTGPVVAGIVGVKKFAYDIWGDTVNVASRMESGGEAGKVNISGSTYCLVKAKFNCRHRGKIQAKNKGEIDMYFVEQEL